MSHVHWFRIICCVQNDIEHSKLIVSSLLPILCHLILIANQFTWHSNRCLSWYFTCLHLTVKYLVLWSCWFLRDESLIAWRISSNHSPSPSRDPPSRDKRDSIRTYISYLTTYNLRLRIYVPHLFLLKIAYPDQDSCRVIPSRIVLSRTRRMSSRDFPDPGKIHGTEPGHTSTYVRERDSNQGQGRGKK